MKPSDEHEAIDGAAKVLALDVPDACLPGIAQNLALLRTHFAVVEAFLSENGRPQ